MKNSSKLFLSIAVGMMFCCAEASAQCAPAEKPLAVKLLEVGRASRIVFLRRLRPVVASYDRVSYQLYIINYGSDAEVKRREKWIIKSPDFKRCPFDCARITLVRGGSGTGPKSVFWKIPPGADFPAP